MRQRRLRRGHHRVRSILNQGVRRPCLLSIRVHIRPHRPNPFLQVQHKPIRRVAIQVVSMQPFTPQEPEALVELYRGGVGGFGFKHDLQSMDR